MAATGTRSGVLAVACTLVCAALFASTVGAALAAGTTDIGVSVERDALESGDTTAVEIVVKDTDGGVGALNATVTLSNPDTASVESVTLHGEPDLERITERADGVELSAALADTNDTGSVTIATVLLRAEEPGETAVDVNVRVLGDEDGEAYDVAAVDRPMIVVADGSPSASDTDESDDDSATSGSDGSDASLMAYGPVGAFGAIAAGAIVLYWYRYQ